jgi:hypothetical protein
VFTVTDHYPTATAFNGDFITRSDIGEVIEERDGEPIRRRERVLVTHIDCDGIVRGIVCFGERTVRNMAHEFGLVDEWRHEALKRQINAVLIDRDALSQEVERLHATIERLRALEPAEVREVYIAPDGSRHGSPMAAAAHVSEVHA